MRHLFFLILAACGQGALELGEIVSTPMPLASEWSEIDELVDQGEILLTSGGLVYIPELTVDHLVPGQQTTFTASGVTPGQWVVFFVGQPNYGGGCGTPIPQARQWMFGTQCLTPFNARPVLVRGANTTADPTGVATLQKTLSLTVPLGTTRQYQAASVAGAFTTLSNAVTKTVVDSWLECTSGSSIVDSSIVRGAQNVEVASFECTAHGGDIGVDDLHFDHLGDPDLYQSINLTVGGVTVAGPELLSLGNELDFHDSFVIPVGQTMELVLEADTTIGGPLSSPTSQFVLTTVNAQSGITGDDVSWIGTQYGPVVTVISTEALDCELWSGTPNDDLLLADTLSNHIATWRCVALYGDVALDELTLEFDGDDRMYELIQLEVGGFDHLGLIGSMGDLRLTGLNEIVPQGGYIYITAYADTDVHVSYPNGSAYSGDSVTPTLVNVQGYGAASGEFVEWTGDAPANTMYLFETKPTVSVNASSPSGAKVPGNIEVFRFNVNCSSPEDCVMDQVIFQISATDNAASDWNNCDTDVNPSGALDAADFSIYDLSDAGLAMPLESGDADWQLLREDGSRCRTTSAPLGYARLILSTPVVVPAGTTHVFSVYMNTSGASAANDDSIRISIPAEGTVNGGAFLTASVLNEDNLAATDTVITAGTGLSYTVGDILCMDTADQGCDVGDEKMLVLHISGDNLEVIRGYMGTVPNDLGHNDASDGLQRMPSSFVWEDGNVDGVWGSYLVDALPAFGGGIWF